MPLLSPCLFPSLSFLLGANGGREERKIDFGGCHGGDSPRLSWQWQASILVAVDVNN